MKTNARYSVGEIVWDNGLDRQSEIEEISIRVNKNGISFRYKIKDHTSWVTENDISRVKSCSCPTKKNDSSPFDRVWDHCPKPASVENEAQVKSDEQKFEEIEDWVFLSSRNTIARKIAEKDAEIERLRKANYEVESGNFDTAIFEKNAEIERLNRTIELNDNSFKGVLEVSLGRFTEINLLKVELKREREIINELVKFKIYEDYDFKSNRHSNYYIQPVIFPLIEFENMARRARETVKKRSVRLQETKTTPEGIDK